MSSEDVKAMCRHYWACISAGDLEGIRVCFADDAFFEDVALGRSYRGKAQILDVLTGYFRVMSSKFDVGEIVATETDFAACWTVNGVHTAMILDFPEPTFKPYSCRGVSVGRIENGKFVRKADYWNFHTFLEQIRD
jgi:steroid delta-isomerase-like uncharacterized protein